MDVINFILRGELHLINVKKKRMSEVGRLSNDGVRSIIRHRRAVRSWTFIDLARIGRARNWAALIDEL